MFRFASCCAAGHSESPVPLIRTAVQSCLLEDCVGSVSRLDVATGSGRLKREPLLPLPEQLYRYILNHRTFIRVQLQQLRYQKPQLCQHVIRPGCLGRQARHRGMRHIPDLGVIIPLAVYEVCFHGSGTNGCRLRTGFYCMVSAAASDSITGIGWICANPSF